MVSNVQLGQILSLPFTSNLPTSGECYYYCQSMQQRRWSRKMIMFPDKSQIEEWSTRRTTSVLINDTTSGRASKDFLVVLINIIRATKLPILWALRFPNFWERDMSCIDVLRMLVLQALQINPQALNRDSYRLSVAQFREASTEEDWLAILNQALQGLPQVYIILDADLLGHASGQNRYLATRWVEKLPQLLEVPIKLFICASSLDLSYISRTWKPEEWLRLRARTVRSYNKNARNRMRKRLIHIKLNI
jgi:hypothetical protein